MQREIAKRLWDAREACRRASSFLSDVSKEQFIASELIRAAVERQFEICGEALSKVRNTDPKISEQIPDIHSIVGLRNRLIHGYDSVDVEILWDIAALHLPALATQLDSLLS